jgi:endo-1,4-beta-D-glucanase Y
MNDTGCSGSSRRAVLGMGLGMAASAWGRSSAAADDSWPTFKRRFMEHGERVIDTGNDNVSHSESQGWGMLFAEAYADKAIFQSLWEWTYANLQRDDGLFSWRWNPKASNPLADKNNASDGDILIAWALARAAKRWSDAGWAAHSRKIQSAILDKVTVEVQGRLILQPGIEGFKRATRQIVNLSYYVWPAFSSFADEADRRWRRLKADGLWLLDRSTFGAYRLPPDWLLFGGNEFRIADGWPPRFGFDAIRIPLYLAWQNDGARLERYLAFWRMPRFDGRPPAWIDLQDGSVAPFPSSGGYAAVLAVTEFVAGGLKRAQPTATLSDNDDYYSASLKLLSNIAAAEAPSAKGT